MTWILYLSICCAGRTVEYAAYDSYEECMEMVEYIANDREFHHERITGFCLARY